MRILALAILAIGTISAAGQARAQTYDPAYPICMLIITWGGSARQDCTFTTLAQCKMTASGLAAQCDINPYYVGPTTSERRNSRRHRRVY